MKSLLIIDMQKALFAAGNRYDTDGVISRVDLLTGKARDKNIPIIFVRHNSAEDGLAINSDGWQILDELDFRPTDTVIEKTCCDSFCETNLAQRLSDLNVEELIITGCCTDFCIDSTVRQAASMGYKVRVASDAHTTADKPYLDAETIIRHHNFVWSEMYVPQLIEVELTEKVLDEV
ncbi:cysteine hydrolase family protein [Desulfovibrio sp. JC010]|uniref:cysteine hydrolase family protein n=1 Tax=Desulfovibrio sp. JC010 TaxID=2593641 RepID=UPI0013D3D8AB|nr:cysteine hydrolase family protein [Desulfovibrio sp. JC010]NDV25526.1 cysteine hydrolase [Desulfovibrio sp. JC010]